MIHQSIPSKFIRTQASPLKIKPYARFISRVTTINIACGAKSTNPKMTGIVCILANYPVPGNQVFRTALNQYCIGRGIIIGQANGVVNDLCPGRVQQMDAQPATIQIYPVLLKHQQGL